MKNILLHPAYFPSIETMAYIAQADKVIWETEDNYQKQTYRNRAYIAHSNGALLLNIPILHKKGKRQKTRDVLTVQDFSWQKQHLKSLQTAYRTSPFFEYYEDDLLELFTQQATNLMDHNFRIFEILCDLIGLETEISKTTSYKKDTNFMDFRFLVDAKRENQFQNQPYTQVLEEHHGFLPNLSILDLLFNEGTNTLNYLQNQELPWSEE